MRSVEMMAALMLASLAPAAPAAAQDATHMTACTTKAECDLRADERDTEARQAAWNANVKREDDYAAQRAQLRANARAEANNGRISRAQAIMHRRHEAAASPANN